jgi:hypothetical protein
VHRKIEVVAERFPLRWSRQKFHWSRCLVVTNGKKILLVAAKIPLVAMRHRKLYERFFLPRDEASHGFHARTQRFFFTEIAQNVSFFR